MKGSITPVNTEDSTAITRPAIHLYPITPYMYAQGSNDYILRVKDLLSKDFKVVNKVTRLGILDIILKMPKCDLIYFNWVADIADRRFGYLQMIILFFILLTCKVCGIKIAWFIHNDLSHYAKNRRAKELIRTMMMRFSDVNFSHSKELSIASELKSLQVFDHPVDPMQELPEPASYENDLLIWGSVSPYKGVAAFAEYNFSTHKLDDQKIVVAGKFTSDDFYRETMQYAKHNIRFINKVQSEAELEALFRKSRYILFCYRSRSVVSSAALCKSLSYGKTIIGPSIGSFKELGKKGLIYTYDSFEEMTDLVHELTAGNKQIDCSLIREYVQSTSWENFGNFLRTHLKSTLQYSGFPVVATS